MVSAIVNIICWPVYEGYDEKIWSWVEFVKPSIKRLFIYELDAAIVCKDNSLDKQQDESPHTITSTLLLL